MVFKDIGSVPLRRDSGVIGSKGSGKSTILKSHGGTRPRLSGRGGAVGWILGRLPRAGAHTRRHRRRCCKRGGRCRAGARPLTQFDAINEKFAEEMSPEEMDKLLTSRQGAGRHRSRGRLGSGFQARARDGRAAPAAGRCRRHQLSGGERRRVALCRCCCSRPICCCATNRPTTLAESVAWLETFLPSTRARVVAITHDRYFLDNAAQLDPGADRARAFHGRATTRDGSNRSRDASPGREVRAKRQRTLHASSSGSACRRGARQAKGKARRMPTNNCHERDTVEKTRSGRD